MALHAGGLVVEPPVMTLAMEGDGILQLRLTGTPRARIVIELKDGDPHHLAVATREAIAAITQWFPKWTGRSVAALPAIGLSLLAANILIMYLCVYRF